MEIEGKIVKQGHSFSFRIPKALVDCKVLDTKKVYKLVLEELTSKGLYLSLAKQTSISRVKYNNYRSNHPVALKRLGVI